MAFNLQSLALPSNLITSISSSISPSKIVFWITWVFVYAVIGMILGFILRRIVMFKYTALVFEEQGSGVVYSTSPVFNKKRKDKQREWILVKRKEKLIFDPSTIIPPARAFSLKKLKPILPVFLNREGNLVPAHFIKNKLLVDDEGNTREVPIFEPVPKPLLESIWNNGMFDVMTYQVRTAWEKMGPFALIITGMVGGIIFVMITRYA